MDLYFSEVYLKVELHISVTVCTRNVTQNNGGGAEDEDKIKSVRETEGNTDECTSRPESWGGRETDSGTI